MLFLIAQIKRFWTLSAEQKMAVLDKAPFLKKSRKTAKNWPIKKNFHQRCCVEGCNSFWVAMSVPKRLILAIKNNIRNKLQTFQHKGGPLPSKSRKKGQTFFQTFFLNEGKKWNKKIGGRSFFITSFLTRSRVSFPRFKKKLFCELMLEKAGLGWIRLN